MKVIKLKKLFVLNNIGLHIIKSILNVIMLYTNISLVPKPHPLTRSNSLVNEVDFLGITHFCNNLT